MIPDRALSRQTRCRVLQISRDGAHLRGGKEGGCMSINSLTPPSASNPYNFRCEPARLSKNRRGDNMSTASLLAYEIVTGASGPDRSRYKNDLEYWRACVDLLQGELIDYIDGMCRDYYPDSHRNHDGYSEGTTVTDRMQAV